MKISICIPTWEQYNLGTFFITQNLESVKKQTYKDFNVIISDHSRNDEIKKICENYSKDLDIKYFKFEEKYGNGPANTNNCIKNSDGEIIKFMFQDDFFFNNEALQLISDKFNLGCKWLVNGCNHTNDNGKTYHNFMIPRWNDKIIFGINTISSPSVLSILKNEESYFDENLTMLMDCDMYYNLYLKYGEPEIIEETLITNRIHPNQISSLYNKDMNEEINYVKLKYFT